MWQHIVDFRQQQLLPFLGSGVSRISCIASSQWAQLYPRAYFESVLYTKSSAAHQWDIADSFFPKFDVSRRQRQWLPAVWNDIWFWMVWFGHYCECTKFRNYEVQFFGLYPSQPIFYGLIIFAYRNEYLWVSNSSERVWWCYIIGIMWSSDFQNNFSLPSSPVVLGKIDRVFAFLPTKFSERYLSEPARKFACYECCW